ncbi:DNA-binding transcriptional regulator, IclR family [Paramicrobacterium humi]|uniref:DNA-binding transcriptional regulator, IclR family n=1 Tax=Paramicrobacterium humi TaxID=640635 RepID=A0A1H4MGK9_9MICO|nr:IclR family transcriptional regulator [Microbacterium humi]SEB82149.1 DNA-binding transcriptional regulator, IclR family [Microbacterium humi]
MAVESKVPAADASLRVLSYLARQRGPVAAATIARSLDLPRSSVYQLLRVMRQHGYVVHLPEERRWGLGVAAFELSGGYARHEPLSLLGRPLLAGLVDELGESAHLAVLHGRDVLYIVEERAPRRPHLVSDVGVRLPAPLAATGRAMLARLPRHQVRALFPDRSAFVDRTGTGPTRYSELRSLLDETTRVGHATEDGEITRGLASVGVAVLDHVGWPAASIAVTFEQGTREADDLVERIGAAAAELSRRISGRTRRVGDGLSP